MEVADRENYLGEGVIEAYSQKSNDIDEQEDHYASASASKSQFRKVTLKARWSDETGMAEVVDKKGTIWRTTGIVRGSKLYFSIEEVLFLIEIGALLLMDDGDISLSLEDMYVKISNGKHGCSWEEFQAYRQLKSLGYIVGRHGVPWSMKIVKSNHESVSSYGCCDNDEAVDLDSEEFRSVIGLFNEMQINEVRLVFDVYLPNSKFRKSSPGDPSFVLCFTRGHPPSKAELEALQRRCGNIPVKVCHVEQGVVSLFSFDKVYSFDPQNNKRGSFDLLGCSCLCPFAVVEIINIRNQTDYQFFFFPLDAKAGISRIGEVKVEFEVMSEQEKHEREFENSDSLNLDIAIEGKCMNSWVGFG